MQCLLRGKGKDGDGKVGREVQRLLQVILGTAMRMAVQCLFRGKGKDGDGRVGERGVKAVAKGKSGWV